MMPINNFNNTTTKIYSTSKGIKVVDSPIKIQILNLLEGQVSEADIVSETGKSKSTISVHLKNLIDEGIISFKSHPRDRRSKLFYILADYIGEIYPDKIIYKYPEIDTQINNKEQLFTEVFRQYKSILLIHGLQLEPLEIETGKNVGKALFSTLEFETFDELIDAITTKFEDLELGQIKLSSDNPLILKNYNCKECNGLQYNRTLCNITKGILKGIFEEFYEKEVFVEEVECISKYDDCCTFIIELLTNNS
ncbi:MAG: ArsR family transcriptional regulator [Methanosphaera sp.]|nr:ArsR family transcriptional regulator [Methanosphaera sp.]